MPMPGSRRVGDGAKMALILEWGFICQNGIAGGMYLFDNQIIWGFEYS